jgi:hypothetical protein
MTKHMTPSKLVVPTGAVTHPLCKIVFHEMKRRRRTYDTMEADSGVLRQTLKAWRSTVPLPRFPSVEAALGAVGWEVKALPFASTLPAGLREDLAALVAKHATELPAMFTLSELATRRD